MVKKLIVLNRSKNKTKRLALLMVLNLKDDWKKTNNKIYLIIGIILFAVGVFIAGTQIGGLVNGITQVILGSLGILCLLKYYQGRKRLNDNT